MSRALFRSALELRKPLTRLPTATFALPIHARNFNSTAPIVEPSSSSSASQDPSTSQPPIQQAAKPAPPASTTNPTTLYPRPAAAASPPALSSSTRELLPLLKSQPNHYITFHIHGRPYLVTPGDTVRLPFHMPGVVPGDVLRLDRASVIGSRDFTLKGSPFVDDRLFECRAVVTGSELEPVRLTVKKKQRTRRSKTVRSQHRFTTLAISELKIKGLDEIEGETAAAAAN